MHATDQQTSRARRVPDATARPVPPANTAPAGSGDVCEVQFVDDVRVGEAKRAAKSPGAVMDLAETFKVLGDPTRVRIAWALAHAELCVCDLAALVGASQSAVSHSLRALRQLRLVTYRKAGKIAYYRLDDRHIADLLADGFRHVEQHASGRG